MDSIRTSTTCKVGKGLRAVHHAAKMMMRAKYPMRKRRNVMKPPMTTNEVNIETYARKLSLRTLNKSFT